MKSKFRKVVYVISVLACITAIIFGIFKLIPFVQNEYYDYEESKRIEEIQDEKQENTIPKQEETFNIEEELQEEIVNKQQVLAEYEKLYNQNNDLYGWIQIQDTTMDYPVMYTPEDANFYVNRDFDKNESKKGSIYVNGLCQPDNENLILYGHNCKDLSMFGLLSCYKEKSYYENHKYIQFDTIYEKATYEIIAVSQAFIKPEDLMAPEDISKYQEIPFHEVSDDSYLFYMHMYLSNEEEFNEYVNNMKDNSYYEIETSAEYGDKLITLCTCTNIKKYQNERLLVIAKKIK